MSYKESLADVVMEGDWCLSVIEGTTLVCVFLPGGAGMTMLPIKLPPGQTGCCWDWNNSVTKPTLTPRVRVTTDKELWHGWVRNGELVSCL